MARICQRCQHHNEDHAKFCLSCGAMLEVDVQDNADPLIGKVLMGRYRPTQLLGEGGMGRVYIAEQKMGAATRKVAIKTLHPELSQDPQIVARFHRESETVIELSHPNTIQFYDFGELENGTLFIVMEYIEGRALAAEMEKGRIDVGRIDKILIQVCGSLHEAHGRGIVHRDLKPDNVLLTDRGGQTDFVKVLDFGIAKKDDAEDPSKQKLTKQGMVLGTPPYMSPEQFSGKLLDARSDIYSLGVMVYEMITGVLPFEAKTPWEWATKHLTASPAPFEAHQGTMSVPQNKKNAVMRALSKDREQRQATILDFLQEFTGYQDAQSAWTMATSSSGAGISSGGTPRPPVSTPGPMQHFGTAATPPPSVPGMQIPGGHVPSQPGVPFGATSPLPVGGGYPGSHPSQPGFGGMPSNPGVSGYGYAPPMHAKPSGGGAGKIIIALVMMLFVIGGGIAGVTLFFLSGSDGGDPIATGGNLSGGNGVAQPPQQPVMQPMQPVMQPTTTPTTPTTPTTTT
ncbi:MAG: protein kinase, partial [Myxococcota bacterium]|nr:protein kinase [Myxococcota bacterium]